MSTTIHSADSDTMSKGSSTEGKKGPKEIAAKTAEKASETAEKARDLAVEKTQAASDLADLAITEARGNIVKASDAARDFTVKQPLATIAGALAVGVVLGMALNNRR